MVDKSALRHRALILAAEGGQGLAASLCAEFGISRQAANVHLAKLVEAGDLMGAGSTRSKAYHLVEQAGVFQTYFCEGLSEDRVWQSLCAPIMADLPENVRDIWRYGLTEMINNAIDHSGSPSVEVGMKRNALNTEAWVADLGEGIFLKIQHALNLYDPREAIFELAKGKFTTDPVRHSGEGIFFSSKVFDGFDIRSGNLHFMHHAEGLDQLVERPEAAPGTVVLMRLANQSPRTTKKVFDQFAAPEEYTFTKTIVPVKLALYEGEKLVSRSQAKRLTQRFERFKTVVLDFDGVEEIGQAFADEVFRVFQAAHPEIVMTPIHTTPAVDAMIRRVRAG